MKRIANYLASVVGAASLVAAISSQAQSIDIDQELSVLAASCPVQWEPLDKQLNVGGINDQLWQDEADYTAWKSYFSGLSGNESITETELARVGSDRLTIASDCAAQRVKVMLLLGGTPLGDAAVAEISSQTTNSNDPQESTIVLGSRVDYPGASCLQIKDRHAEAESGYYWVKFGIASTVHHVFCEMEHAGGGWMYWGFFGGKSSPTNVFGQESTGSTTQACEAIYPERVIAARSCRHIQENGGSVGDGVYQIDMNGNGETEPVWCDMTTDGGGWTYLMHKNTGVLSDTNGSVQSAYLSGNAGLAKATDTQEWFRTYKKCNSSDNCNALSEMHWSNPIGANQLRLSSVVSGNGNTQVNGNVVVSIKDDSTNSCETHVEPITEIHSVTGDVSVRSGASYYGGCGGVAQLSQVSVREPAGLCAAASNADPDTVPAPVIVENTINVNYDKHRRKPADETAVQSLFALSEFADSEMILSLDTPSIQSAKAQNKYIRYRYAENSSLFNKGPLPCTATGGFEYSKDDENYLNGSVSHCTENYLYMAGAGGTLPRFYGGFGVSWGTDMGGNNSWYHPAWIYVR